MYDEDAAFLATEFSPLDLLDEDVCLKLFRPLVPFSAPIEPLWDDWPPREDLGCWLPVEPLLFDFLSFEHLNRFFLDLPRITEDYSEVASWV